MSDQWKEWWSAAACVAIGAGILLLGFFLGSRDKQTVITKETVTNYVYLPKTEWRRVSDTPFTNHGVHTFSTGVWWHHETNYVTATNWITLWRDEDHSGCEDRYMAMARARDGNMNLRFLLEEQVVTLTNELVAARDNVKLLRRWADEIESENRKVHRRTSEQNAVIAEQQRRLDEIVAQHKSLEQHHKDHHHYLDK